MTTRGNRDSDDVQWARLDERMTSLIERFDKHEEQDDKRFDGISDSLDKMNNSMLGIEQWMATTKGSSSVWSSIWREAIGVIAAIIAGVTVAYLAK